MKAKKLVAVGMTVLMLGGLFVGCGNSADTSTGANSGKNVKITIFQSKIEANEGYKKLIGLIVIQDSIPAILDKCKS